MEVTFADTRLERLANEAGVDGGLPQAVVGAYQRRIQFIKGALDERDLYAWRSFRFEKLKGARSHQRSIRLNDQWRLVVEIVSGKPKNTVHVVGVEDYHK